MSFGDPPSSTPLEEAMKPPVLDEYSEEQLKLIEMNIPTTYVKGWFKKNLKAFTVKGKYRQDFFDYLMKCCSLEELNDLGVTPITTKQQTLLDKRIEEGGVPENKKTDVAVYIDKNQELLRENKEYKQLLNKCYKDIAKLQGQRDSLKALCLNFIEIFMEQKVVGEVNDEHMDTLDLLIEEVKKNA